MNIYKELFENWIPDMPTESPKQDIVIYEAGQQPGANDSFFTILSDFYTSFHTDYGPVFTLASYIVMYIGISIPFAMYLWNKWADWAARSVQIGCGLLLAYLLLAVVFGFSDSELLRNNSVGMLSRLFLSMAIHIPIIIVLIIIAAIISPQDPAYKDPHEVRRRLVENEFNYLEMKRKEREGRL